MRVLAFLSMPLVLGSLSTAVGAEKAISEEADLSASEVIDVEPVGQPITYFNQKREPGPKLFVWWADGAWHVRARTEKLLRRFDGKIHVVGGKVTRIFNFQRMETGRKRDLGFLDKTRTNISFQFLTRGREDGFDFTVSPTANRLRFELTLDGVAHPEVIIVGAKGTCAPSAAFTLPAHPNKEPGPSKGK